MLPRWASRLVVLIGAYLAVMSAAALWLPHEWDWAVWDWLSAQRAPAFDASEIAIVDVPWTTADIALDRTRIAAFLNDLVAYKQSPTAVILDVQFGPCPTQPCEGRMASARQALIAAIHSAPFPIYALEQPTLHSGDVATGLEPHDPAIYAVLTGAAHTRFTTLEGPSGRFYRACYDVPTLRDDKGNVVAVQPVWDMVQRVAKRAAKFAGDACDPNHIAVRLPADPVSPAKAVITKLSPQGTFPASAQFGGKDVIVGTIEFDHQDALLKGPELLAWSLSNALEPGTAADAESAYDTEPQGGMLLVLVPGFSALAVSAFVAIFFLLKGTRLRALRPALPWISAGAAAIVGLGILAVFEFWLLSLGHIQPQVTLIALGMLVAVMLASLRAFQYLFDQTWTIETLESEPNDYDVFISYGHDESAWVSKHVYAPLRDARLPNGRKLNIFFDTNSIRYGTAWQDKITLSIDGSRFIVPVYSETYFNRPYCMFEIMRAHLKWIKAGSESRCVLPIMRGNPKIPATVADFQAKSLDEVPNLVDLVVAEIVERLSRLGESAPPDAVPRQAPAT